jgi:hypothetical protein
VAALGASYGGFMINWIAGVWNQPFKALVSHEQVTQKSRFIANTLNSLSANTDFLRCFPSTVTGINKENKLADADKKVSDLYGMIHPNALNNLTVRSVFIIDPNKKLRLQITYPASTGRNFQEILRVIDSLQLTDYHSVATPVNWKDGEDCVVVPSISTEDARAKFPKGVTEVRPYLRFTPQPNK